MCASPIPNEKGDIIGSLHIAVDTTALKKEEHELRKDRRELERQVGLRSEAHRAVSKRLRREIEERRQAEQALRKREQSLAEAQRIAHIGSYEWDMVKGGVVGSEEAYRIFGLPPGSEVAFDRIMELIVPEDREGMRGQ